MAILGLKRKDVSCATCENVGTPESKFLDIP
jgi:hypothetical protein